MERLAVKVTIGIGLAALIGVRACLRVLQRGNTEEWRAKYPAHLANAAPVEIPAGIYEECTDCPPEGMCLSCFDLGLKPHACAEHECPDCDRMLRVDHEGDLYCPDCGIVA